MTQDEVEYIENGELGTLEDRGEAVAEATTLMDEIRPALPFANSTAYAEDMKIRYAAGKRFRVAKEGARLEGIRKFGKIRAGYAESLDVGDELVSTGWRESLGGGGYMEANFATETSPTDCLWLQFWPMESLWSPWPMTGWLEPVAEDLKELGS